MRDLIVNYIANIFTYGAYLLTTVACLYGVFVFFMFFFDRLVAGLVDAKDFMAVTKRYYEERKQSDDR